MHRDSLLKTAAIVVIAAVVSAAVALGIGLSNFVFPSHQPPIGIETALRVKLFVTTLTVVMLLALLWNYVAVYRDLPNRFTLSLLLFTLALFFYALSSNPLLPIVLGFRHATTLGPFVFIPDIFASIAVVVLLYQSFS